MKFICHKELLENYLNIADRFSGKNLTLPILSNVMLETVNDNIRLTATNLEQAVQINVKGKVLKDGKICVPSKTVNLLVQSLKDEELDIEEKQNNLVLKTTSKEVRLNGLISEDFPLIPSIKRNVSFNIDTQKLQKSLGRVITSVAVSDFKPEFTGIYFNLNSSGELKLVATDTFRLAEDIISTNNKNITQELSFIIPSVVGRELARITNEDSEVKISLGDNQVIFETGVIKLISRLIDGKFPDYEGIIPKNFESSVFINRNEFKDAIKAASIFSSRLSDVVLEFKEKGIKINTVNQDLGEYKTTLAAKTAEGNKDLKLSFNYHYLLDGLNSLDEDEISIGVNSENSPSLFKNKSNKNFTYVLMPIRLT